MSDGLETVGILITDAQGKTTEMTGSKGLVIPDVQAGTTVTMNIGKKRNTHAEQEYTLTRFAKAPVPPAQGNIAQSIISVPARAANDADAKAILEEALNNKKPFGVPTVTILQNGQMDPETLPENDTALPTGRPHETVLTRTLSCMDQTEYLGMTGADILAATCSSKALIDGIRQNSDFMPTSAFSGRITTSKFGEFAHNYSPNEYVPPAFNRVIAPNINSTAQDYAFSTLGRIGFKKPDIPALPGSSAQWGYMYLLHEYGHGTGAGEPQTEKIAAIACRKAFEDQRFLKCQSDLRAIRALACGGEYEKYGFPMVQVLDQVNAMDQSEIDAMTEVDMIALRHETYEHDPDLLASTAKKISEFPGQIRTIADLGTRTENLMKSGLLDSREYTLAERFALACRRLSIGEAAYDSAPPQKPTVILSLDLNKK